MNSLEDVLELRNIGGIELYNVYCRKLQEFILNNPGQCKNEYEISKATSVPLVAVRRAIREGKIGYSKEESNPPKNLDEAAKKFRESNKVDIVTTLNQQFIDDRRKKNEKVQIKGYFNPALRRTSAKPIITVDSIMKRTSNKNKKIIMDGRGNER